MKKLLFFSFLLTFVIASKPVYSAEQAPFGIGDIAVKVDSINFTAGKLKKSDVGTGLYFGFELYGALAPNLYIGTEIGYANPDGEVKRDVRVTHHGIVREDINTKAFVPIELSLKYAIKAASNFIIGFGAGISNSYIKTDIKKEKPVSASNISSSAKNVNGWLLGGQCFSDLNYTRGKFLLGVNAKYTITEEFKHKGYNYNNWRIGGQIGKMF